MEVPRTNINFLEPTEVDELDDLEKIIEKVSQEVSEESIPVVPEVGFCVKIKDDSGLKFFLNFCHCSELPSPDRLSEDELKAILHSDDPSNYRIPMSLGEPHKEEDKGKQPCLAYDIIVSDTFYSRTEKSELFQIFLVTVGIQGIEDKFSICLQKDDWTILKNKRYHGTMPKHCIRRPPKVVDISTFEPKRIKVPTVQQDPLDWVLLRPRMEEGGLGPILEARFHLDKLEPAAVSECVRLEVNEERLILSVPPHYGPIDVDLPNRIQPEQCSAIYRKHSKVLHLKLPIHEAKLVQL